MSLTPREAGKKACRSGQRKILPKNGEISDKWGPGWEAEWLAGWEEADILEQRKSQDYECELDI